MRLQLSQDDHHIPRIRALCRSPAERQW